MYVYHKALETINVTLVDTKLTKKEADRAWNSYRHRHSRWYNGCGGSGCCAYLQALLIYKIISWDGTYLFSIYHIAIWWQNVSAFKVMLTDKKEPDSNYNCSN